MRSRSRALARPWEAIFCHEESHVHDDECGAPEFFAGGAKLVGIPGLAGKITPEALAETLARYPRGLVKSRATRRAVALAGHRGGDALYRRRDRRSGVDRARGGIAVHMDGARFANAIVAPSVSPAEMTWRAGVDVLSFGATKNGALACEAVIFFDPDKAAAFAFQRKRGGHTLVEGPVPGRADGGLSQGRPVARPRASAPMPPRRRLAEVCSARPGVRRAWPTEANEVFVVAPTRKRRRLARGGREILRLADARAGERPRPGTPRDPSAAGDLVRNQHRRNRRAGRARAARIASTPYPRLNY